MTQDEFDALPIDKIPVGHRWKRLPVDALRVIGFAYVDAGIESARSSLPELPEWATPQVLTSFFASLNSAKQKVRKSSSRSAETVDETIEDDIDHLHEESRIKRRAVLRERLMGIDEAAYRVAGLTDLAFVVGFQSAVSEDSGLAEIEHQVQSMLRDAREVLTSKEAALEELFQTGNPKKLTRLNDISETSLRYTVDRTTDEELLALQREQDKLRLQLLLSD